MLKLQSLITPSAMLAAFTLVSAPSFAQEREHGRRNPSTQESSGRSAERAQPRGQATTPQVESRRDSASPRVASPRNPSTQESSGRSAERAQPRGQTTTPQVESRRDSASPRVESPRVETPRAQSSREANGQRAVPRRDTVAPRGGYDTRSNNRGYSDRRYEGRSYEPSSRYGYSARSYYRPYVFRPRISIGFGIFAGYPVPYTYRYPYPIMVYGYRAPRAPVMIGPGSPYYGGVALEITPFDADVYVDGSYAGRVEDFDGRSQPLTLTAGTHRVEVQAPGYQPLIFDVGVQPDQVIPYRGDLRPY